MTHQSASSGGVEACPKGLCGPSQSRRCDDAIDSSSGEVVFASRREREDSVVVACWLRGKRVYVQQVKVYAKGARQVRVRHGDSETENVKGQCPEQ